MTTPTHTYRILKISDPRSRGTCYWFEIEGMNAAGDRWHVGTVDTRTEARQLVATIEAADRGYQLADDDADDQAANLDRRRRTAAVRLATARAVADTLRHRRDDHAARLAAARELAAAVAEYDAAWNDDSDFIS
jgi:hypothetical protein